MKTKRPRPRVEGAEPRVSHFALGGEDFLVVSFAAPETRLPESLTPCEREVALLVLQGASNAEIAKRRGTSPRTVANQMASMFRKLGVGSRVELVKLLQRGEA
jgi:DNA-binding CsgD family transcriptional regulator